MVTIHLSIGSFFAGMLVGAFIVILIFLWGIDYASCK